MPIPPGSGVTYIFCIYHGEERKWGLNAHPSLDTSNSLKEHLKKHAPEAKFLRAEYHDQDGFVFEYGKDRGTH